MKLYRINRSLEIVESGDCDWPRALQVLQECYDRGLKRYVAGEEAISETDPRADAANMTDSPKLSTVWSDR